MRIFLSPNVGKFKQDIKFTSHKTEDTLVLLKLRYFSYEKKRKNTTMQL